MDSVLKVLRIKEWPSTMTDTASQKTSKHKHKD